MTQSHRTPSFQRAFSATSLALLLSLGAGVLAADEVVDVLLAGDGQAHDHFGASLAADGDTLLVSAHLDDDFGDGAGSAYFLTRDGAGPGVWSQQKVQATDGQAGDQFSFSAVAVDGVGPTAGTAVIGAYQEDDGGSNSGAAYVFLRGASGNWAQHQRIKATDAATSDQFGRSVATSGELVFVGAPADDDVESGSGSVYVFTRLGGIFSQTEKLTSVHPAFGARFGWSLAAEGLRVAVGVRDDPNGAPTTDDAGAVEVYTRNELGVWGIEQKLTFGDPDPSSELGHSVDLRGDTLIAGAPGDHHGGLDDAGAAIVWRRSGTGIWLEEAKLTAPDAAAGDELGSSVALEEDLALVGARVWSDTEPDDGAVYVFERSGTQWSFVEKLSHPDPTSTDAAFGHGVVAWGDLMAVGARYDDAQALEAGAVHLWRRQTRVGVVAPEIAGAEPGGIVTITVDRGSYAAEAVTVDFASADGSGVAGVDYAPTSGSLSWDAGDTTSRTIDIEILDDADVDPEETFEVRLTTTDPGVEIGAGIASVTIEDNELDPAGSLLLGAEVISVREAATTVGVTVTRVGGSDGPLSLDVATDETGGSTAEPGSDYVPTSGSFSWADGEGGPRTLDVTILDDDQVEGDEAVLLVFSDPVRGVSGTARQLDLVVVDDEAAGEGGRLRLSAEDYRGFEHGGPFEITVVRLENADGAASVSWRLLDDSATGGEDYEIDAGSLDWPDGDASPRSLTVTPLDDSAFEGSEHLRVQLHSFEGAAAGDVTLAQVELVDDDTFTDLSLEKADAVDPLSIGQTVLWSLAVTNDGPATAPNVVVTDVLPPEVSFVSAAGPGWDCGEAGGTVTCARPTLPPGPGPPITVEATAPPFATDLFNTANVTTDLPDAVAANDADSESTTVVDPRADLSILKEDLADPVEAGAVLTYTLAVSNAGPATATNVRVTDVLPAGVSFVGASGDGWECSESEGTVLCSRSALPVGAAPGITLEVTAPETAQTLSNTASIAADNDDPDVADDSDTEQTEVIAAVPPRVASLQTVADTGDGSLDDHEQTVAAVTQIYVTFDLPMSDPPGHGGGTDVTNPENYLLLGPGEDGVFDTPSCGGGPSPADAAVQIDAVDYDGPSRTSFVAVNGGGSLEAGGYRLLVCGSLQRDDLGTPLDGNGDGIGGDDSVHEFRILETNVLRNPNLDTGLGGWLATSTTPGEVAFHIDDASNAPTSGSVEFRNLSGAGATFALSGCHPARAGFTYPFVASARVESAVPDAPEVFLMVELFGTEACAGEPIGTAVSDGATGDTSGSWEDLEGSVVAPETTLSALFSVVVAAGGAVEFDLHADDLALREVALVFADGFESGGVSAWGSSARRPLQ